MVKQPLSLVSNATEVVQGELRGVGYKKRRNAGGTKRGESLEVQSQVLQKTGGILSFLLAGKVDPSPAPAGFHHRGSGEKGTWGHSQGLALRGALRARQNICKNKTTKPPERGCAGGPTKAQ